MDGVLSEWFALMCTVGCGRGVSPKDFAWYWLSLWTMMARGGWAGNGRVKILRSGVGANLPKHAGGNLQRDGCDSGANCLVALSVYSDV